MPVFENRVDIVVRGVKMFLKLEAGVARDSTEESASGSRALKAPKRADPRRLEQVGRRLARKGRTLGMRARGTGGDAVGVRAGNVVWIFGTARTGSTWLSRMMGELEGHTVWREPLVGALFGNLYYDRAKHLIGKKGKHYILGDGYRDSWLVSIRDFVLREASGRFPEAARENGYLIIKEPNGAAGAPLLLEALPESRMILLIRDPRDVIASTIDARREGGWQYENRSRGEQKVESPVGEDPDSYVRRRAKAYLQQIGYTKQAYEAHKGPKVLVRYEELRADTLGTMKRIYSALGIPVEEEVLVRAVEKHSWEKIPEEEKGEGKVFRKATPGGWREDLTPEQAKTIERITAPLLEEFYSA